MSVHNSLRVLCFLTGILAVLAPVPVARQPAPSMTVEPEMRYLDPTKPVEHEQKVDQTHGYFLSAMLTSLPLSAQGTTRQYVRPIVVKTNLAGPSSLFVDVPTTTRQRVQVSLQRINFGLFGISRIFRVAPEYKFRLPKQPPSAPARP